MPNPVVFFSRCKPHGVNLQQLAIEHECVFFGWPLRRPGTKYDPQRPESYIVPPDAPESDWRETHSQARRKSNEYSKNRNLVRLRVGHGSIAMIPCHERGLVYCGYVRDAFRVIHNEEMYQRALDQFSAAEIAESDDLRLAAELCQGWDVEKWIPLPTPIVPAWIRASLFGRSTYGVVSGNDAPEDPWSQWLDY